MPAYSKTTLERIEVRPLKTRPDKLPIVADDWSLAFRLGFRARIVWYALLNRDKMYKRHLIKKATGGLREIHNPNKLMRLIGKQIRARILLPLCEKLGPHVTAYQLGKSTKDAAQRHINACAVCDAHDSDHSCSLELVQVDARYKVVRHGASDCLACMPVRPHACTRRGVKLKFDLKNFFGSTRRSWVRKYFHEVVGYNHYASSLIAQLVTVTLVDRRRRKKYAGVPQGSKTSGDICNLVAAHRLDPLIINATPGWTYSRYADDLYFSHPENLPREEVDATIDRIVRAVQESGYRVNRKKLRVQRPHRQQKLLGIVLNHKVNIPAQKYRRLRAIVHNCYMHGFETQYAKSKQENINAFKAWLEGNLNYVSQISPQKGARLKLVYEAAKEKHAAQFRNGFLLSKTG
jgi:retron-type reverse transcriptase